MAAGTDCGNGAQLTWGGTTQDGDVTGITFNESAAPVQVSTLAGTQHVYCAGQVDYEVTVEFVGVPSIAVGDGSSTHAIAVAWKDAGTSTDTITGMECFSRDSSAAIDGAITTTLSFRPVPT